jgi:Domain of unknown function (DUF4129)
VTDGPLTRLARALLLAAAAAVLVGLVAVSAAGYRLGESGSAQPSPYAVDAILSIVIALYLIGAVAVIAGTVWAGLDVRRRQPEQVKRRRTARGIMLALGALAVLLFATERFHLRLRIHHIQRPPSVRTAPTATSGHASPGSRTSPNHRAQFRLAPFLAVLAAAGLAVGAIYTAENRRRRRLPREAPVAEELADVLDETLDDLRSERDPRRAVIAAYARMERVLGAHGIPRRRFEAPHEYLGRVLAELTGGRAAEQLTALFELARFSPHEVDSAMKAEAIEAIEALQAELALAGAAEAA